MAAQVLDDQSPVARKQHRCTYCSRFIEPGERYRRLRVITDDGPDVWKSCAHCERVYGEIWRRDLDASACCDDGIDLAEYLREHTTGLRALFERGWSVDLPGSTPIAIADLPVDELPRWPR